MRNFVYIRVICALLILLTTVALAGTTAHAAHTQATLILGADAAAPGSTVLVGVQLRMEPGWHTYWKNPGEAGEATSVKWQLPPGVTAGEIQWPSPQKLPPADITTYGYDHEVVLLVPLSLAKSVPEGPLTLSAKVSWLECKESCIPASSTVEAVLTVAQATTFSTNLPLLKAWQAKVPASATDFPAHAWWETTTNSDTRMLNLQWAGPATGADLFPAAYDDFDIQGATENLPAPDGQIHLRKLVKKYSGDWPKEISGVFVTTNHPVSATVQISSAPPPAAAVTAMTSQNRSLWQMLLYAFIGGLILNIMPCVLPVIALKVLGFVTEARSEPRRVRLLGVIYTIGVLCSFAVLALIAIGVKAAGHQAGWGMQFGSPIFVVCVTVLVTLVALNLFGVFEVTPGGRTLNAAGELASRHGAPGAFFNGVLATVLATPCTAPFLAAALGFALLQPSVVILAILLSAGLGLAAPYLVLSCNPAWLKFLPKPGAWMEKFKIAMGFPMLATVVWLFNVASAEYGSRVFWLGVFLVIISLAAWIFGEFVQRGRKAKGVALVVALVVLFGGYTFALENRLHWRTMSAETDNVTPAKPEGGIDWKSWSPEAVRQARTDGRPVLVDFTARWCVTCNAIVKPALENESVAAKLKEMNAVALLADYTRTPPEMTAEISKYGAAGVPLVLVYPKDPEAAAIVLPQPSPLQLPSGYSKTVLNALDQANQ